MTVTKFPVKKVFPHAVKGREVWAQDEPPQEMVWAVCPYTRSFTGDDDRCKHCPTFENDPDHGQVQRSCYGMAAETCRVVFAMQKRKSMETADGRADKAKS